MKLNTYKTFTLLALLIVVFGGCQKDFGTIETLDSDNITAYIKQNNLNVQQYNNTGIYYQIIKPGTGPALANDQQVAMVYTVKSLDGKYSSTDTLFLTKYANYAGYINPAGFKIGVYDILKKGNGEIRLLVPSKLGYGRNGSSTVPGNASLDIWVRVIDKASLPNYEEGVIQQFLTKNALTGFSRTASGIYYKISAPGTGASIRVESAVTFKYTGKLLDGRLFDSSDEATFYLEDLVAGWKETIPMLKEGGAIRIIVPSSKGYGFSGSGNIPPFADLDFEITATKVFTP